MKPVAAPALMTALALLPALLAAPALAGPADSLFDWVTITGPGNRGYDRQTVNPFLTGRGRVDYEYRIARTEVSTQQYLDFVNTFATQSDALADLIGEPSHWGAERDPGYAGPGRRYRLRTDVANAGLLPLIGVSWHEAAYYINWLNNDLSADPSAIADGAYDISTFDTNPADGFTDQDARHPTARYFLPTWDESLKAFHWDPNKDGPGQGGWWIYNDASDTQPIGGPPGIGETSANWFDDDRGPRPAWETPLGSYKTRTPWGLIDASGGGAEWTESWVDTGIPGDTSGRYLMGNPAGILGQSDDATFSPGFAPVAGFFSSFRVAATIPTQHTLVCLVMAVPLAARRRRP